MTRKQKLKILIEITIFILIIFFDQFSKYIAVTKLGEYGSYTLIDGILAFEMLLNGNSGGAWGVFAGRMALFYVITIIFSLIILFFIIKINYIEAKFINNENILTEKTIKHFHFFEMILVLLLGGAYGNFIDRIRLQYVIDFIRFKFIDFPIFNVSDCFITISVILMFICILFVFKDDEFNLLFSRKNKIKDEKNEGEIIE